MLDNEISFSSLRDYPTVEECLLEIFSFSRSWLKKHLLKKYRSRTVKYKQTLSLPSSIVNYNLIAPIDDKNIFSYIGETSEVLAVYKSEQTHSYPLSYSDNKTSLNWIRDYDHDLLGINKLSADRGLLYRLDFETSGVLLYAKTEEVLKKYRSDFNRQATKTYYAIVQGNIESQLLEHWLVATQERGRVMRAFTSAVNNSKYAKLELKKLAYDAEKNLSIIKVQLYTGHRHQIRVQLSTLGFPILGDILYGGEQAERLYLHAYAYELGDHIYFEAVPQGRADQLFNDLLGLYC